MKNSEIVEIYQNKDILSSLKGNYNFTKAVTLNLKKIDEEVRQINSYMKPSKGLIDFMVKKEEILKRYSDGKTTKNGDMVNYVIPDEAKPDYLKEINDLIEANKETLEEAKESELRYKEALESQCTILFNMINEKDMPNDISIEQMQMLINFVKMDQHEEIYNTVVN